MEKFSGVLSWIIETHVDALTSLTSEIAPYIETTIGIDEEKGELYFPTSTSTNYYEGNVDNLLLRSNFIGFPYEYLVELDRVKKNIKIPAEKMRKIKEKTVDLMKAYASTKEALKAIEKASNPISNNQFDFAMLRKTENVTNVNKLKKYEKVARDYMNEIRKIDWNRFPQVDPSIWKDKSSNHVIDVAFREFEKQLFQYPFLNWFPLNIHTDVERMLIPFFIVQEKIDDSYEKCKNLFERCKKESGFLRGPPDDLKNEAVQALEELNVNIGGLSYPELYAGRMLRSIDVDNRDGIQRIRPHKFSLEDIDRFIARPKSDGSVEHAEEIIKQLHYIISLDRNINHP
jgi:hypothetical protein